MGGTHHECGPSCSFVKEKLMFTPGRTLTDWDGTRAAVVTKISSLIALICLLALEKARVCKRSDGAYGCGRRTPLGSILCISSNRI